MTSTESENSAESAEEPAARRASPLRLAATNGAWLAPSFLAAYLLADRLTADATTRTWCTLLLAPVIGLALRATATLVARRRRARTSRR
ncbi:hypothetical protein ACFV84_00065 [Kitasatospora sp. NPDC059811]|uniref:hypothetical protein n=1 Tax=Streptomycetaceae TaxID=2062 RepID=UPI0007AFA26C|nr:hypothetical protein [Streptomyces sp. MJM8645]